MILLHRNVFHTYRCDVPSGYLTRRLLKVTIIGQLTHPINSSQRGVTKHLKHAQLGPNVCCVQQHCSTTLRSKTWLVVTPPYRWLFTPKLFASAQLGIIIKILCIPRSNRGEASQRGPLGGGTQLAELQRTLRGRDFAIDEVRNELLQSNEDGLNELC